MKVFKKVGIIAILCLLLIILLPKYVNADGLTLTDIKSGGDSFVGASSNVSLFNEQAEKDGVNQMYYIILGIGIILSISIGIILGIQFMTTGVEGKAKVKEKLIAYAIGVVVVFGAFGIWRLTVNVIQGIIPETQTSTQTTTTSGGGAGQGSHGGSGAHR